MTTKVTFELPASIVADATEAIILGEFNNWNPEEAVHLYKNEDGSMKTAIDLVAGRTYQYRYLLNDRRWVNDERQTVWVEAYGSYVENTVVDVPEEKKKKTVAEKKPAVKKAVVKKAAVKKAVVKKAAVKKAVVKKGVPVETAAVNLSADDLTKVEGIGKKIATLLIKNGISTYQDLGKSTGKNLKTILDAGGKQYNIHNPSSWPEQAKMAAEGKWDELNALQATLKGGK